MNNFVKSGDNLTLAAPYDVLSGGGFKVGNVFGVAANDTLSGVDVECDVEGVYDLAKDASTFSQGDLAYWDDTAKKVTSTVASNLLIGAVEVAAATGAAKDREEKSPWSSHARVISNGCSRRSSMARS